MSREFENFDKPEEGQEYEEDESYDDTYFEDVDGEGLNETDLPDEEVLRQTQPDDLEVDPSMSTPNIKQRLSNLRRKETHQKSKVLSLVAGKKVTKGANGTWSRSFYDETNLLFREGKGLAGMKFRGVKVMKLSRNGNLVKDKRATVMFENFRQELTAIAG